MFAARRTMLACKVNHLQMEFDPIFALEKLLEVLLDSLNGFSFAQPPSPRAPVDVRVDRKRRLMKSLRHHDRGCLVADAGKRL